MMKNMFAGILENLGKALSGYGMGQIQHQQAMELEDKKNAKMFDILAAMGMGGRVPNTTQSQSTTPVSNSSSSPAVGSVVDGFKFLGGDPSDKNNWQQVR